MINKKYIEERYLKNPEPEEITKTRDLILDSFKDLSFVEKTHQYFVGDQEYPPVSTVCHTFEPYVDWDDVATKKAQKLGKSVEDLKREWHENNILSTSCGSKTHYFGEQIMRLFIGEDINLPFQYTPDNYIIPYCGKEEAIIRYWEDILKNPDVYPVLPEAKLYHPDLNFAGTFDILLAYRLKSGEIVYSIHDYKGLPLDTPILTNTGWKIFEDLEIGDLVYDGKHELTPILNLSEIHYNPCFRIIFDNGYSIVADHEHRWLVWNEENESSVITSNEIEPFLRFGRRIWIEKFTESGFVKLEIVNIESVPTVPTRCIEVKSPEHTYLVDKEMIVTHNTNKDLANSYNRKNSKTLLQPFQDFINEPLSMYSIQLSLYQLGLEQLGIKIFDRNLIWLKDDGTYIKQSTPDLTKRLLQCLI